MANVIKPKRSSVAGNVPTTAQISQYEIAMNTADKKIYTSDGINIIQIASGNLSGLSDVSITAPSNGQGLSYNSTTGKWVNSNAGTGTVTSVSGTGSASGLSLSGTVTTSGSLTLSGTVNSVSASSDQAIVNQHDGNSPVWYGRILSKNSTNDRAAFLGTYGGIAGVFAHNNALNAWADLYINTVDGSGGGTVRLPSSVLINGSQAIHAGNYTSYAPSLTGSGASGTWGINITGNASTATNSSQLNGISSTQLFNNMGQNHGTQTDFNAISDFGVRYVQGGTNGPTGVVTNQFYGFTLGLGNDYALSSYASQFYWPRAAQNADTYIYVRDREGGTWGSWRKIKAGYADSANTANNADTVDNYHASSLWRSDGGVWNPSANITLGQTANGQEWSFDITRNGYTGGLS